MMCIWLWQSTNVEWFCSESSQTKIRGLKEMRKWFDGKEEMWGMLAMWNQRLVIQRWWPSAAGVWILCMQIEHLVIKWSANMLWNVFVTYYGCHGSRFSPLLSLSTFSLSPSHYAALTPLLLSVSPSLVDVYVLNVSITQPWGTCTKNWTNGWKKSEIMRALDIGKMVMKWSSINGDTVVVGVFMIKIFNRVVVKHYAEVSVLVEHSALPLEYDNPFSLQKPAHIEEGIQTFHSDPFIIILQDKLYFSAAGIAYIKGAIINTIILTMDVKGGTLNNECLKNYHPTLQIFSVIWIIHFF